MKNVSQTIISQYANDPVLARLIANFDTYIDPQADLAAFLATIWDVRTANTRGLDIWGRIVGVTRYIRVPSGTQPVYFGFKEGAGQPFGQAAFFNGNPATNVYELANEAFRTLIMVKALTNISVCTAPSLNQLLNTLFSGRGRCYVQDLGDMQMSYAFEFDLLPFETSIIATSGAFPRPVAVSAYCLTFDPAHTFGFAEAGAQPFGQGVFINQNQMIGVA